MLNPFFGLPILLLTLFLVFQGVFSWAEPLMDGIDAVFTGLQTLINQQLPEGPLRSLLADGVIAGVGSVLVFIPQILILFAFVLTLEDVGYMARAAFLIAGGFPGNVSRAIVGLERFSEGKSVPAEYWAMGYRWFTF